MDAETCATTALDGRTATSPTGTGTAAVTHATEAPAYGYCG